jgi:hypothetical protein
MKEFRFSLTDEEAAKFQAYSRKSKGNPYRLPYSVKLAAIEKALITKSDYDDWMVHLEEKRNGTAEYVSHEEIMREMEEDEYELSSELPKARKEAIA